MHSITQPTLPGILLDPQGQPCVGKPPESVTMAARSLGRAEEFRPIQYLGSKKRLVEQIRALTAVGRGRGPVCDLFTGSGTVAHALAYQRDVTAVDVQEYSRVLSTALLGPAPRGGAANWGLAGDQWHTKLRHALLPLITYERRCLDEAASGDPRRLCDFVDHASLRVAIEEETTEGLPELRRAIEKTVDRWSSLRREGERPATICEYYGGTYFSFEQAAGLDALLARSRAARLPPRERTWRLAVLLSVASATVNTVGKQFAQPMRLRTRDGTAKPLLVQRTLADRTRSIGAEATRWAQSWLAAEVPRQGEHTVIQADATTFLRSTHHPFAAIYADPPYTIDHYSRFYHVLETMALGDAPPLARMVRDGKPRIMRGLYREDRYQSPFCIPSQVRAAFAELFGAAAARSSNLILSYSPSSPDAAGRPRLLSVTELQELALDHYSVVTIVPASDHAHRKLNAHRNNAASYDGAEAFIVCVRPGR